LIEEHEKQRTPQGTESASRYMPARRAARPDAASVAMGTIGLRHGSQKCKSKFRAVCPARWFPCLLGQNQTEPENASADQSQQAQPTTVSIIE